MAKTFQTVISDARSELGDTYAGNYAYSPEDMLRYAVEGVREAWRTRPSWQYDTTTGKMYDADAVLPDTVADSYFLVPMPTAVQYVITYFIIFRCLSRDVTDQGNANAAAVAKARFDAIVAG